MVCASATQVNMVSATVEMDMQSAVNLTFTRLPSDLNYVRADYWDLSHNTDGSSTFLTYTPLERYTLSDNPDSPSTHFIFQSDSFLDIRMHGPGGAGTAFSSVGTMMLGQGISRFSHPTLSLLDEGTIGINYTARMVTRWAGQLGASFIVASTAYNGWSAISGSTITVFSTGGRVAACYESQYAIAFIPLALAATIIICWVTYMLFTSVLLGYKRLEQLYGGINPYADAVCPTRARRDIFLVWQNSTQPRLEVLPKEPIPKEDTVKTAVVYFKSAHSHT
jgi:hypothetical protein